MQNKLNFCRYYNNEDECPYKRGYKREYKQIAWESEKHVCETEDKARDASEFLHLVVSAIGENDRKSKAQYIALYDLCSVKDQKKVCEIHKLQDIIFFEKPRGRTIYESIGEGSFIQRCGGTLLYENGEIYTMYGWRVDSECAYILENKCKSFANKIKSFIKDNWLMVKNFPKDSSYLGIDDGATSYFKFLSKRCTGYEIGETELGKQVVAFDIKIRYLFHYFLFQSSAFDTNEFIECWDAFMDMVIADKKEEKILDVLCYGCFPKDCEVLGFNMDSFESFNKKYGNDFEDRCVKDGLEKAFSLISDYQILGNAIYSKWRYYTHWATDPIAEFDANWFKAAFKRLKELRKKK